MKIMLATFVSLFSATAFAGVRDDIARCGRNDAVCVGNVIVDYIENSGGNDVRRVIRFYETGHSGCVGEPAYTVVMNGDFDNDMRKCMNLPNVSPFGLYHSVNNGTCIPRTVSGQSPQALCKTLIH